MKLVVIDFDGVVTVANVHTHNQLYMANFVSYTQSKGLVLNGKVHDKNTKVNVNYDANAVREYGKILLTKSVFQFSEELVVMIRDFFESDIIVVIATHNHFPDIVSIALEKLGFTSEEIDKIDIISGFPMVESEYKNEHIELAMKLNNIDNVQDVILIDDSYTNCSRAEDIGCNIVWVRPNKSYFQEVQSIVGQEGNDIISIEFDLMKLGLETENIINLLGDSSEESE
jgi:hypothetical protein